MWECRILFGLHAIVHTPDHGAIRHAEVDRAQPNVILLRIQPNKHTSAKESVMADRITASTTLFEMTAGN